MTLAAQCQVELKEVLPAQKKRLGWLAAVAILACFFVAFFWPVLARYSDVYYSPADISQTQSLTRVENGIVPGNELLSDLATQMEPWLIFNRSEFAAGRIPLWNPYNGGGSPHLANGQAAVFSPFSLPYYLLSFRAALIVSATLKLLALGGFTYLFLRLLGLFILPSMLGAVAFAFAGHNVLLLGYPHPAAAAALPAGLYFVERSFQRFDDSGRHSPGSLVGLCLSMAIGLAAGQPEPCFFAIALIGIYAVFRAVGSWRKQGGTLRMALTLTPYLLEVAIAAVFAVSLGSFKALPFIEYLRDSHVLEERSHVQTPLQGFIWPTQFFPNLLGNPSSNYYLRPTLPPPNFETANLVYIGGLVLFLAFVSLVFIRRHRAHAFFAVIAGLWILYAYDVAGAWHVFARLPAVALAPINRSQCIWLFAVACCAAFGVQRMLESEKRRVVIAVAMLAIGAALLFVFKDAALSLHERFLDYLTKPKLAPKLDRESARHLASLHIAEISGIFGWGCLAAAAGWLVPRGPMRQVLAAGIVVMVYLGSGNLFKQYNPLCENRFFYPVTPAIEALKESVGDERLVILGENTLIPDTNMVYGLSLISSYDGLWVRRYDRLFRELFGESNNWRHTLLGSGKGLRLFGADWVLSADEWIAIDTEFGRVRTSAKDLSSAGEVVHGVQIQQGFTVTSNRLQAIRIFATQNDWPENTITFWNIEDAKTHEILANGVLESQLLELSPTEPRPLILKMHQPLKLKGRRLVLRFRSPSTQAGFGISLWARRDAPPIVNDVLWRDTNVRELSPDRQSGVHAQHPDLEAWGCIRGDQVLDQWLWIDFSFALDEFEYQKSIKPFDLFHYRRGVGRWHVVSRAMAAASEQDAWVRTLHPALDPSSAVVLEGIGADEALTPGQPVDEVTPIEVQEDLPMSKRLKFTRQKPGWLVLTQPWYPGWIARVNGAERTILRANYAFGAVKVDAGESVVELSYEPRSFAIGAWITLASALIGAGLVLNLRRGNRARAREEDANRVTPGIAGLRGSLSPE